MSKGPIWRGLRPNKKAVKIFAIHTDISTEKFKAERHDVGMVVKVLHCVLAKWVNLGDYIKISASTMEDLKKKCKRNTVRGLIHVVDHWMKGEYEEKKLYPCWWSVVYMVADSIGGDNPAAARIIAENWKKYQKKGLSDLAKRGSSVDLNKLTDKKRIIDNLLPTLKDVQHKWFEIGVLLGVPVSQLERFIEEEEENKLRAVIKTWLTGFDKFFHTPTMQILIDAVADSVGGANKKLAEELTAFNPENNGFTSSSQEVTPSQAAATSSSSAEPSSSAALPDRNDSMSKPNTTQPTTVSIDGGGKERIEDDGECDETRLEDPLASWDKCDSFSTALTKGISTVSDAWKLGRLDQQNLNGTGTVIAILDTAIDHAYPIRVRYELDCCPNKPIVSRGHGTTCAAIAVAHHTNDPKKIKIPRGVAPGAQVDLYRIADGDDSGVYCSNDAVLMALDSIIKRMSSGNKVDVVSISYDLEDDKLEDVRSKITELTEMGVTFVAPVGNRAQFQSKAAYPARFDNVIKVGSLDEFGERSKFTPDVDIDVYAPGELKKFFTGKSPLTPTNNKVWGTSLAAPAIGGIVLLLKQLANEIGDPVIKPVISGNIHRVNVLKAIFKKMTNKSNSGLPIFEPVEFLLEIKRQPLSLYQIVYSARC